MKLSSTVLALAALAVSSLLGGAEAGLLDGPCTITADMSTLSGTCPSGGFENCIGTVKLSPNSDSSTPDVALNSECWQPGLNSISTQQSEQGAGVSAVIRNGYSVVVAGISSAQTRAGIVRNSDGAVLCEADASVTSGTCLYSDRSPSDVPSSAATQAHAGLAVAAAALYAGASLLM